MRTFTGFAGAGLADIGLTAAGCEHVRCVEWDDAAARTLEAAGFPAWHGDIRDPACTADVGPIDLAWFSPPCQDWSSAGKRKGADGDRNGWPWTWDAVDRLQPRWFIAENVTGMLHHAGKHCGDGCCADTARCPATYFHEVILAEARKRFAWVGWRVLDAADLGTPQFRRRVFVVGGPRPIDWPEPTHGDPETLAQVDMFAPRLLPWVSCGEALGLAPSVGVAWGASEPGVGKHPVSAPSAPSATCGTKGNGYAVGAGLSVRTIGSGLKGSEWGVGLPSPGLRNGNGTAGLYVRTEQTGAVGSPVSVPVGTVGTVGNQYLHSSDPGVRAASRPAATVTGTEVKGTRASKASGWTFNGGPDRASDSLFLATGRRRLSPAECSILMGAPADYPYQGNKSQRYAQVGNGVVPIVAQRLAEAVMRADR
jgi:DNA (cytosine-5)-methyltransferase 1